MNIIELYRNVHASLDAVYGSRVIDEYIRDFVDNADADDFVNEFVGIRGNVRINELSEYISTYIDEYRIYDEITLRTFMARDDARIALVTADENERTNSVVGYIVRAYNEIRNTLGDAADTKRYLTYIWETEAVPTRRYVLTDYYTFLNVTEWTEANPNVK